MSNARKTVLVNIPFEWFYNSLYSEEIDNLEQSYIEYRTTEKGGNDEFLANSLGTVRVTKASRRAIIRRCKDFQSRYSDLLTKAKALVPGSPEFRYAREPLDDVRCGQLLWFANQGHGVSWCDNGDAKCLELLQKVSRRIGETPTAIDHGRIYVD